MRLGTRSAGSEGSEERQLLYGLNEFCDVLDAVPSEIIRHMTNLSGVDGKHWRALSRLDELLESLEKVGLDEARQVLEALLPAYEERIQAAGGAAEAAEKQKRRLDDVFKQVGLEFPEQVRLGPRTHPAYISGPSGGGTSRSEARREAVAARRAERENVTAPESRRRRGLERTESSERMERVFERSSGRYDDKGNERGNERGLGRGLERGFERGIERESAPIGRRRRGGAREEAEEVFEEEEGEEVFCVCRGVSYGEMVACDSDFCKYEWFHLPCVQLTAPPKGRWFCPMCTVAMKRRGR
jgi:hypothetical protein